MLRHKIFVVVGMIAGSIATAAWLATPPAVAAEPPKKTEPQSTKILSSGGPAKGGLEVIAGTAKKYGIAPGDRVAHPLFSAR